MARMKAAPQGAQEVKKATFVGATNVASFMVDPRRFELPTPTMRM